MSAYMVDESTLNMIVAGLSRLENTVDYRVPKPSRVNENFAGIQFSWRLGEFWKMFYDLNVKGLVERYPTSYEELVGHDYKYSPVGAPDDIQLLKSIQCLLYQASEGDVVKDPTYVALSDVATALAFSIVERTPQYEKANWG